MIHGYHKFYKGYLSYLSNCEETSCPLLLTREYLISEDLSITIMVRSTASGRQASKGPRAVAESLHRDSQAEEEL